MLLPLVFACLLLPSLHLVECARSTSSYRKLGPGRQTPRHPRQVVRTPRMEEGKLIKVIDVSDDDDQEPDTEGEYTGASLTKPGMPADFTVCGAWRTEVWTTVFTSADLFRWYGNDGTSWGSVELTGSETYTLYNIEFGNVKKYDVKIEKVYFPFDWVLVCASLNTSTGNLVLVVDGQVLLDERLLDEVLEEDESRPTNLNMSVGYEMQDGYAAEFTGQYSNLNIFSEALPTEKMEAMTQAGSPECGSPGDYLSWEEADWQLQSQAKIALVEELDGPCKKLSLLHIYTGAFDYHSDCMEHCQKMGKGRSPPLRTGKELETLRTEIRAITNDTHKLPFMWLSLTDKEEEGVWRDHYSRERTTNYTKPWQGLCTEHWTTFKTYY